MNEWQKLGGGEWIVDVCFWVLPVVKWVGDCQPLQLFQGG
jgi:hypothetical protein